jgi:flagellin
MSNVINTNVQSLIAQNALKVNGRAMSHAMEQLSTGRRINSASDDAAGLAISQGMTAQIRSMNMAVRNANDGISMAQTAEGSMIEISNMLQRMRELAVQSANGTLDSTQRGYLDTEFKALSGQIDSVIDKTSWNGISILAGSSATNSYSIQTGTSSGDTISVDVLSLRSSTSGELVRGLYSTGGTAALTGGQANIVNATNAAASISAVDGALNKVSGARASLGAVINRLTSAADNLTNVAQNLTESRSRIADTDYAAATTELARTMIIQQAGTAVLAQANQMPQTVLALLR